MLWLAALFALSTGILTIITWNKVGRRGDGRWILLTVISWLFGISFYLTHLVERFGGM